MDIRGAKLDRITQYLVHEPDDRSVFGGAVQVGVLVLVFVNDLKGGLLAERIDGVGTDAEAFLHFPLNRLARSQHGLEPQATSYSFASHRRTSSSERSRPFALGCRAKVSASIAESCLACSIRSSNCRQEDSGS